MQHLSATLEEAAGFAGAAATQAYAEAKGIHIGEEADFIERLQRVAASEKKNPDTVHHTVPTKWRPAYY